MDYLPLSINLRDKNCLIVGAGLVAFRKASRLQQAGAKLSVIAPEISDEMRLLAQQYPNAISLCMRSFELQDVEKQYLIVAATDNRALNAHIATLAKKVGALINVVDQSALSDIIFPAIIEREPLHIALSTSGKAPALLRLLRSQLEGLLPRYYGQLAHIFDQYRAQIKSTIPELKDQRLFWKQLLHGKTLQWIQSGQIALVETLINNRLAQLKRQFKQPLLQGSVALVGAGPGDPELLTLKALRLIQWADVILYDRLVSPLILEYARDSTKLIYVGKQRSDHSVPQDSINNLLVHYAQQGKQVVRLKGGDPFIFGRGGEEIEQLSAHGIYFEVVPGISAANGCAAYAGIPLTHRDYAHSVRFVPGYSKQGDCQLDWQTCVDPKQTLVIYMGSQSIATICQQLIAHGRAPQTPIALIEQGTQLTQKIYLGELHTFPDQMHQQLLHAPTLLIIGDVVKLHSTLNWFERAL